MKSNKNIITALIAVCLTLPIAVQPILAQHQHSGGQQIQPSPNQMQMRQVGQQHMMSMNEMMQHMNGLVSKTSDMMKGMHEMGGHGAMGQMQGNQAMMNMHQSLNDMAKDMQKFMEQMHQAMSDQNMMKDPSMKNHMEEMQKNMGSMMQGMDGVVKNLNNLHEGEKK